MGKVVSALFISVDGVTESPDKWQFDSFDDDMGAAMVEELETEEAMLMGRVTYEEWAPYWPNSKDEPFASFINNRPKFVVSTTLDKVEWGDKGNITLVKGDLAGAIGRLKEQFGGRIGTGGSPTLVRSLLEEGLLDELTLLVHPVVVGGGKRLFKDGSQLQRLKLIDSKITGSGVAILTYRPDRNAAEQ